MTDMPNPTLSADALRDLQALYEKAMRENPLPWDYDTEKCDGEYGSGDEGTSGYNAYAMFDGKGVRMFGSENSHSVLVEVEYDEDGDAHAWDELARRQFDLASAAVNALPALLTAAAEAEKLRAENDAAYELGKEDGRSATVQEIDQKTGGDGEYVYSTFAGEGCPTPETMIERIVERFSTLPRPASGPAEAVAPVAWQYENYLQCVGRWMTCCSINEPAVSATCRNVQPLYAAPPPPAGEG